jgi:hypothetical protein
MKRFLKIFFFCPSKRLMKIGVYLKRVFSWPAVLNIYRWLLPPCYLDSEWHCCFNCTAAVICIASNTIGYSVVIYNYVGICTRYGIAAPITCSMPIAVRTGPGPFQRLYWLMVARSLVQPAASFTLGIAISCRKGWCKYQQSSQVVHYFMLYS